MRNLTHQIKLCFLACFVLLATLPQATIAQTQLRDKIDVVGYYFVEPAQVVQDSQSAAITLTIPVPRGETFEYAKGLQVVFITEKPNGNSGNITIQINSLDVVKLLTRRGVEFGIGELDAGIIITATYDGMNFRSDFDPPPEFRFAMPTDVTLTGNAYSVTDTSLPPVATAPLLLGIKAKATNTGNVTLSLNGSQDYAVYFSNGEQIASGALEDGRTIFCTFTNVGGVGFRAINLHNARTLKGTLVATTTLAAGSYTVGHRPAWTVESGVTELSTATMPGGRLGGVPDDVPNGLLVLPNDRFSGSQLGWFLEITKGSTPVYTRMELFGFARGSATVVSTSDDVLSFTNAFFTIGYWNRFVDPDINNITIDLGLRSDVVLTEEYVLSIYVTEN